MHKPCTVLLFIFPALLLAACDSALERKAREEAAINAGTATATAPAPDSSAAIAAAREAAAAAPDPGAMPPQSPAIAPRPSREEVGSAAAKIECRPDISAEDCEQARASLEQDANAILDEHQTQCLQMSERVAEARREIEAQSGNFEADLDALAKEIDQGNTWITANCTG